MHAVVRLLPLALCALGIVACGGEAPPAAKVDTASPPAASAAPTPALPNAATLDTTTLRQRAADALAANRLYAPAGDNAVEDYLALRDREPGDTAVDTALLDLAPYVVIGAEQATAAEAFPEAERLIDLLARMDPEAPAVPRLRTAFEGARSEAEARATAEEAEATRQAADAERRLDDERRRASDLAAAPTPAPPPATTTPQPTRATTPAPTRPTAPARAPTRPTPAPTPAAPVSTAAAARTLVNRVSPRFPESATRRRLEGEVELSVQIRADGSVEAVDVVRADPPGVFDREAVLAVRRWRYAPADTASEARVVLQFKRP